MPVYLKQSTASQEVPIGPFLDSTDGDTAMTGLTIANTDIKIWRVGATTLANKTSGGATHISAGVYYTVLDATDTATLGSLVIFVHVATALAVRLECVVLAANVYDAMIGGGDFLNIANNTKVNKALAAFMFIMTDSSGNAVLSATVSATRSIDGGAFAACANSVSEIGNGWYKINLAQADMNGTVIALRFTATGARDTAQVLINLP